MRRPGWQLPPAESTPTRPAQAKSTASGRSRYNSIWCLEWNCQQANAIHRWLFPLMSGLAPGTPVLALKIWRKPNGSAVTAEEKNVHLEPCNARPRARPGGEFSRPWDNESDARSDHLHTNRSQTPVNGKCMECRHGALPAVPWRGPNGVLGPAGGRTEGGSGGGSDRLQRPMLVYNPPRPYRPPHGSWPSAFPRAGGKTGMAN